MIVDAAFRISTTESVPCDHGYFLASAIARHIPCWHGDASIAIHPVSGTVLGNRMMKLRSGSRLRIRVDAERVGECLILAGKSLRIGNAKCEVGVVQLDLLQPAPCLKSRLVTIKGYMEEQEFYIAVEKKLEGLAIGRSQIRVGKRRTLNVKGKHVVGFQVTLNSLSESQSIAVQRGDMWSRRRFGCGVFVPMKEGGSL